MWCQVMASAGGNPLVRGIAGAAPSLGTPSAATAAAFPCVRPQIPCTGAWAGGEFWQGLQPPDRDGSWRDRHEGFLPGVCSDWKELWGHL